MKKSYFVIWNKKTKRRFSDILFYSTRAAELYIEGITSHAFLKTKITTKTHPKWFVAKCKRHTRLREELTPREVKLTYV